MSFYYLIVTWNVKMVAKTCLWVWIWQRLTKSIYFCIKMYLRRRALHIVTYNHLINDDTKYLTLQVISSLSAYFYHL